MRFSKFLVLGAMVLLAGCIPSLDPLYTEKDLVYDPALLGTWADKDNDEWVITRGGEREYEAVHRAEGESNRFKLRLLDLDGTRFVDLEPKDSIRFKDDFFTGHFMPVHTFYRLRLERDRLQVWGLEEEPLKRMAEKPVAIAGLREKGLVLTGSTKELQDYVRRNLNTPAAFADAVEFRRVK